MVIQHNMQAMFANGKLNGTGKATAESAEKLASGYRINRSADDAAGLTISEKMRVQIRGLNQASENIQDGNSLVGVADGALNEIHSIMQRQRELLVQAGNDTNTDGDRQAIEDEISELSKELDRIFEDTEYNTMKIFKGEETLLSGPTFTTPTTTTTNTIAGTPTVTTKDVWLPKTPAPDLTPAPTVTTTTQTKSETSYRENETVYDVDEYGHASYQVEQITSVTTTTTTVTTTEEKVYTPISDPDYTNLKLPGKMVGSNGYINVTNVKGDLNLSCAMSQLGVRIDGHELSLDLYSAGGIHKNTVTSPDGTKAETAYDLGGVTLTQIIELTADAKYQISYKVENTDTVDHKVDVRLAFDVMNTAVTSVNDNTTTSFDLKTDFAEIGINAGDVDKAVLGDINKLYNTWTDRVNDGDAVPYHTGVGYWWEDRDAAAGGAAVVLGPINYGPITLLKDPYVETTTKTIDTEIEEKRIDGTNTYVYEPTYLDIQSGSLGYQNIPIRLWDLSAERLGVRVPLEVSAFTTDASLVNMDRAIEQISSIRSYYGAIYNRLEHAYLVDDNTAENTQAAESRVRDLNMADEMVTYSKNSILSQFGQSMLAQSNQSSNRVLELLQ